MMRGGSNAFDVALHRDAGGGVRWVARVDARLHDRGIGAPLQHFAADSAAAERLPAVVAKAKRPFQRAVRIALV